MNTYHCLKIFTCLLIATVPSIARSESSVVKDPIRDYLRVDTSINRDRVGYVRSVSDVWELVLDFTQNGNPVTLLSTSLYAERSGHFWVAYLPVKDGYKRLDGDSNLLCFPEDCFYVGNVPELKFRGLLAYLPGSRGGYLVGYKIENEQVTRKHFKDISLDDNADRLFLMKYFGSSSKPKSAKEHPVKKLDSEELKKLGYHPFEIH